MKDNKIVYKGKEYTLEFNLNVMERIQEEYGTLDKWGKLTEGENGEVNLKALIFGIREMLNEGIDIKNEENGTNEPLLTLKQAGRIITELGINNVAGTLHETVIESTGEPAKNA